MKRLDPPAGPVAPLTPRASVALRAAVEPLERRTFLSAPGDLDATFANGGRFVPDPDSPAGHTVPTDLAVQPDGKLLYLGIGYNDVAPVVRLNPNGSVDTTFGQNGLALSGYGPYLSDGVALAVGPQGKIAAAGFAAPYRDELPPQATLVVYNADGTLDTNLDADGILSAPQFPRGFSDVAFQADGKLVVVGPDKLVRFNADGSIDNTFGGGDGIADYSGRRVLVDAGGKLAVLGYNALYRFTTAGTLDPTFDGDGVIPNLHGTDIALAPDGDILLIGNGAHAEYLTRFNPNGSLDTAFGNATPGNTYVPGGQRLAVGANDIFVGDTFASTAVPYDDFEIRAYTPAGKVDKAFGNAGRVQTDMNDASKDALVALGLQPDGKLIALGQTEAQPAAFPFRVPVSGLARYLTSAPPPAVQTPFNGTPLDLPGTLQFENYDYGGEGIAFHDTDAVNQGAAYRTESADVQPIPASAGAGYALAFTRPGEWTEYTFTAAPDKAGRYDLVLRYAAPLAGGSFRLDLDGKAITAPTPAFATGAWQAYKTLTFYDMNFAPGTHVLRLTQYNAGSYGYVANFDSIQFTRHRLPRPGSPWQPGETIDAERYDEGDEGSTYHDTEPADLGGGNIYQGEGVDVERHATPAGVYTYSDVAYTKAGEWLEYTVENPNTTDLLTALDVRLASLRAGGRFHVNLDGVNVASFTAPATGSWQTYITLTSPRTILVAPGTHVLRLAMDQNNSIGYVANFDWLRLNPG